MVRFTLVEKLFIVEGIVRDRFAVVLIHIVLQIFVRSRFEMTIMTVFVVFRHVILPVVIEFLGVSVVTMIFAV